jgi:hypothetical protein
VAQRAHLSRAVIAEPFSPTRVRPPQVSEHHDQVRIAARWIRESVIKTELWSNDSHKSALITDRRCERDAR